MKLKRLLFIVITILLLYQPALATEISRNNNVDWVAASAMGTSTSHFVQWKKQINVNCIRNRTRFSIEDKEIMSLLLSAKMSGKNVGFYYELTATTSPVVGHGTECQIVNVWLESE